MPNETILIAYSEGLQINPNLTITNIAIYGNFTRGMCHLQIKNFSTANDGIYQCTYFRPGSINIQRYNVFSKKPPTDLTIVNASEKNIIFGKEEVRMGLKCTVKTGVPAATLVWRKQDLTVSNGSRGSLLYQFTLTRFDHIQSITCYAFSDLLTSPLSQTIYLDIQYPPDVTVTSTISEQNITLHCVADVRPDNYTFYDWEHKLEFNEHIRRIRGTQKGELIINKSQKGQENENDGIYMCTVSNGISNLKGKTKQEGQSVIMSQGKSRYTQYKMECSEICSGY
ncbi:unnamed protein product [Mytilus coruscus]|uniref:Ig-like domain-containing protein n=1 Tax=Mytilus coruscus TaxID=42192 RepID=A0A6J8BDM9_MYTCO|nr:unnamed protein product [Mytilus coruscus]